MARKIKEREGAPMDTSASSKSHGSEFGTLEDTHESNNDDLTNTALAADRHGLSNRAVAAVINAFQMDIGRVSIVVKRSSYW